MRLEQSSAAPEAVTFVVTAQTHGIRLKAKGLTAPDKSVSVKSGTSGNVVSTPVREGTRVSRGTPPATSRGSSATWPRSAASISPVSPLTFTASASQPAASKASTHSACPA